LEAKGHAAQAKVGRESIFPAFTQTWDLTNQVVRLHDGVTKGGIGVLPIFAPPEPGQPPMAPFMPQTYTTTLIVNTPFVIQNTLGRYPIVQVIDRDTGAVTIPTILHKAAVAPSTIPTIEILNTGAVDQNVFIIVQ
jgi:hypothetical protein